MRYLNNLALAAFSLAFAAALGSIGCGGAESAPDDGPAPGSPTYVRDASLDVEMKSTKDSKVSHLPGSQCMECHQKRSDGPGLFTVAGTVTDKNGDVMPGATVQLTSEDTAVVPDGGEVYAKIVADALGNFYTTEALPFPDPGAVPSIISVNGGKPISMQYKSLSGACNFCHIQAVGGRTGFKDLE